MRYPPVTDRVPAAAHVRSPKARTVVCLKRRTARACLSGRRQAAQAVRLAAIRYRTREETRPDCLHNNKSGQSAILLNRGLVVLN
jgi:hypothetical protein